MAYLPNFKGQLVKRALICVPVCDLSILKILILGLCLAVGKGVWANEVKLHLAYQKAGGQEYFVELLEQSLRDKGYNPKIQFKGKLPQKRLTHMVQRGELSLIWRLRTAKRDKELVPVRVDITNGLIGQRILLIPKGQQEIYSKIKNLDDFRLLNKVGVFGVDWYDSEVWHANNLPFIEQDGMWQRSVYRKVASKERVVDYFSRGFFEILNEWKEHPYLDIEQHLMFVYDRDFWFYLSPQESDLQPILEEVLKEAKNSGLMESLIKKHWSESFKVLKPDRRTIIHLATPDT